MGIKDASPSWCFSGLKVLGQHGWVVHGLGEVREAILGWLVPGELGEGPGHGEQLESTLLHGTGDGGFGGVRSVP